MNEPVTTTEVALLEQSAPQAGNEPQAQTPPPAASAAPEMYDVKVGGQTFRVPLDELRNGYQRQQDYTRKTTEVSEYRRAADQEISTYKQQLEQVGAFLNDPRVQQALRTLQATGVTDPNQQLTAAQVQQLMQSQGAQQQQLMQQQLAGMAQEIEVRTLTAQYTGEIDSTIQQAINKHNVLSGIVGIEALLKQDVAAQQPANLQEAKHLLAEAAQQRADRLMSLFQNQQKQVAVQQAQLVKGGIETGGQAPAIVPPEKKFKLGDPALFQAAVSDMMQTALNK